MDKNLSIIIPAFNAGLFIEKCIRSCAEQDLMSAAYEIIVINDGSKDDTDRIIRSMMTDYSNIVYIDQSNGGVSSARNAGLGVARGEYVWFVDADDWIEKNCLGFLLETMKNKNLDALQFNAKEVTLTGEVKPWFLKKQNQSPILSPEIYLKKGYFEGYAHMTLSKRNIIEQNHIRFNKSLKMREDLLFNLEVATRCERIQRLNINPYYYCLRPLSASVIHDNDSTLPLLNEIRKLERQEILVNFNNWLIPDYLYDHIDQNIFNISNLIDELKSNGYQRVAFRSDSRLKVKLFFALYNLNNLLALYLLRCFKLISRHYKEFKTNNKQLLPG